MLFFETQCISP